MARRSKGGQVNYMSSSLMRHKPIPIRTRQGTIVWRERRRGPLFPPKTRIAPWIAKRDPGWLFAGRGFSDVVCDDDDGGFWLPPLVLHPEGPPSPSGPSSEHGKVSHEIVMSALDPGGSALANQCPCETGKETPICPVSQTRSAQEVSDPTPLPQGICADDAANTRGDLHRATRLPAKKDDEGT